MIYQLVTNLSVSYFLIFQKENTNENNTVVLLYLQYYVKLCKRKTIILATSQRTMCDCHFRSQRQLCLLLYNIIIRACCHITFANKSLKLLINNSLANAASEWKTKLRLSIKITLHNTFKIQIYFLDWFKIADSYKSSKTDTILNK